MSEESTTGDLVKQGLDGADKAVAANTAGQIAASGENTDKILKYPLDIASHEGREMMRFNIKSRNDLKSNKQTIFLYTPPGVALADAASYSTQDFGWMGGLQSGAGNIAPLFKQWKAGETSLKDMFSGQNVKAATEGLATQAKESMNIKALDIGMITAGKASNPNTNLQFGGVGMRSFTFSFKMVAESKDEADAIRSIENTFRKFLYPSQSKGGFTLKYPPYWQIQFFKAGVSDLNENPYLPYIDLCYLRNISVTYNSSTNAFHKDGTPVELDMSLSFDEAQQNTREDLYKDADKYDSAEYSFERGGLTTAGLEIPTGK